MSVAGVNDIGLQFSPEREARDLSWIVAVVGIINLFALMQYQNEEEAVSSLLSLGLLWLEP
jgi:hypothetical protein